MNHFGAIGQVKTKSDTFSLPYFKILIYCKSKYKQNVLLLCKIIAKDIKKILKIFAFVVLGIFLMLSASVILLKNSNIQNRIAVEAAKQLSAKLNTKVSIGKVNYEFFNTFSFNDLYVEDLQKDTLLFVDKAYADFHLRKFFSGKFLFNKVQLERLHFNLVVDTFGVSNLDFVIKAFQSPKKNDAPTNVEFNFKELKLVDSRFSFTNLQHPAQKDTALFDGNRMRFYSINADVGVDYFKNDSLAARVNSLSLTEKSGLRLKNFQTSVRGLKTGFWMPKLILSLPNSDLVMDSLKISYDSISHLKDIMTKVRWKANIRPSAVNLGDLATFYPNLKKITQPVAVSGRIRGLISSFSFKDIELKYGKTLTLKTDLDLNGIPNLEETFVYADVKSFQVNKHEVQDIIAKLANRPVVLPKELARLGNVRYNGNISGFFSNLVAYGNIATDAGNLKTDILLQFENQLKDLRYNGMVQTSNFQLGTLLASNQLGKASFSMSTKGTKLLGKPFQGTVKGNIAEIYLLKYNYRKILLDGSYDGNGFDGKVNVDDPNLTADFNGVVDLSKVLPVFNFELDLTHADVNALQLTEKYKDARLSFHGKTNMVGNSLDNLNGFLTLYNISFVNSDKTLDIKQLSFASEVDKEKSKFTITSDLANGIFEGSFKYSTLPQTLKALVENYIPALSGRGSPNKNATGGNNFLNIDLTLSDTKQISDALELPFSIDGNTYVKGYIDDIHQRVELNAATPFVSFGNKKIQDIDVSLNNLNRTLNLSGKAGIYFQKDLLKLTLNAAAARDSLHAQLAWQNSDSIRYEGEIQAVTKFRKIADLAAAQIHFLPTQVIIADSIWDLKASKIDINPDTTFTIHNFKFQNGNQYITLNGAVSKQETDTLHVNMNNLEIGYILDLLNLEAISIKGKSTGNVNLYSILQHPVYEADLYVKGVSLNDALIGNVSAKSSWDKEKEEIKASAVIYSSDLLPQTFAEGVYIPKADSLDFMFNAQKVNLGFLQKYLGEVAKNVQGVGTGKVRMYGKSHNLGFEGSAFAENARVTIDYLKTTYSFSDTVYLTRKSITFNNITLYDEENNTANLNGALKHNGSFQDMKYDVYITTENLLALNTQPKDNDFFYGKAYAGGNVRIYGNEENTRFDINLTSRPNTKFNLSIGRAETAGENNFITFVNRLPKVAEKIKPLAAKEKAANIFLNMEIDVNPDAEIQLLIDPKADDRIAAMGNGNLRLTYNPHDDLHIYGGYTIDKGNYVFTLQNLLRKEFRINQGSSITWSGDPFHANLNIRAIYSVTASLRDLMDETLATSTSRSSVPVNVILRISDDLTNPAIKFDVDLPSSDETLKIQIKNTMNTQDMINRQVAYLLLFGKFYTPEYAKTTTTSATSTTGGNTLLLLSNALMGQVNGLLAKTSNNFSLGFNVRGTGLYDNPYSSQEYESAVFYQPNNRLIINGNFGYRNDNLSKNKIIGDLDVEYILTNNGKLRLKAYNHTVDRYTLRSAQFIQGVGIMYKETFNSWDELMRHYWNLLISKQQQQSARQNDSIK